MGVFNKTPYTNFHELNLNWIIKKIKEVAADNAYFKQFFKTIEDDHILGVVTKVTENNNNTVKTDYLNEDTQQMDNYTVYNKTGTDGAISGAVTPIATRVTSAEGRLDDAEDRLDTAEDDITSLQTLVNQKVAKNVSIASGSSLRDFLANSSNTAGAYIINIQQATDNPKGTGNVATAIAFKHTNSGYVDIVVYSTNRMWISTNTNAGTMPASISWYEIMHSGTAVENLTLSYSNAASQLSNISVTGKRYGKVILVSVSFTASSFPLNTTYQMLISGLPARAGNIYPRARALSGFHSVDGYIGPDGVTGFRCLDSTGITASTNFSNFNFIYLEA